MSVNLLMDTDTAKTAMIDWRARALVKPGDVAFNLPRLVEVR